MAKVKPHAIDPKEKYKAIDSFFEVISGLKAKDEIVDFFLGLLTASESLMMARRIQIAKMLIENKSYDEIKKKMKVSSQTIHTTDTWLHKGDNDYNKWLTDKIAVIANREEHEYKTMTYKGLLNKYPHHSFIKKLFE